MSFINTSSEHYHKCNDCYIWIYKRGLHYGYPVCCIEGFSSRLLGIPFTPIQLEVSKNNFIPCRMHSILIKKGDIRIEDLIRPTRKESKCFSEKCF